MVIGLQLYEVPRFWESEYSRVSKVEYLTSSYKDQLSDAIATLGPEHECNSLILIPEPIWEFSF